MQSSAYEETVEDQNAEQPDQEATVNVENQQPRAVGDPEITKMDDKVKLPSSFFDAKREVTSLVEDYFNTVKQEYIRLVKNNASNDFRVNQSSLAEIKRHIQSLIHLQPRSSIQITVPNSDTSLFVYCPEQACLMQLIHNKLIKRPILRKSQQLPSIATPISHGRHVYLLDGSVFDETRKVFVPYLHALRINVTSGQTEVIQSPKMHRIKGGIVKHNNHVYLLSGFVAPNKYKSLHCERFDLKLQKWEDISPLNKPYGICTATVFNDTIYLLARQGIERLRQGAWQTILTPYNMSVPSFAFMSQINQSQIIILGGWEEGKRLDEVCLYSPTENKCSRQGSILPCSISGQKTSGLTIAEGRILVLSSICGQVFPQLGYKKGVFQLLTISNTLTLKNIFVI